MNRLLIGLISIALVLVVAEHAFAEKKLVAKSVEYTAQGVVMKGYLVYDESIKEPRPGVLVVHEFWGQNEYVRKRARMLAELGYTALALDMYGGGHESHHPDDAKIFSSELNKNFELSKARFLAALEFLKKQPQVDPDRIAAIGYCFGGGVVLNMALQGADLKGVASFHGGLSAVKPAQPGTVKAKILVCNGADDKFITAEQIAAFKEEAKKAGADLKFINYPGAVHSFTNPDATETGKKFNMAVAYNAKADKESWEELKGFLEGVFKK
jgi:dienelactone hydrolase